MHDQVESRDWLLGCLRFCSYKIDNGPDLYIFGGYKGGFLHPTSASRLCFAARSP